MDHLFECPRCKASQLKPLTRCVECDTMFCDECIPFGFGTVCTDCAPYDDLVDDIHFLDGNT